MSIQKCYCGGDVHWMHGVPICLRCCSELKVKDINPDEQITHDQELRVTGQVKENGIRTKQ
jgi:hypothetical protein